MPYFYKRVCPICYKANVANIARHLREVHVLDSAERKPYLEAARYQLEDGANVSTKHASTVRNIVTAAPRVSGKVCSKSKVRSIRVTPTIARKTKAKKSLPKVIPTIKASSARDRQASETVPCTSRFSISKCWTCLWGRRFAELELRTRCDGVLV